MTSRVRVAAAVAALAVVGAARAQEGGSRWEFDGAVPVELIGGHTTYEISASDGTSTVRSELRFPLQTVLAGLRLRAASPWSEGGSRLVFELAASHSLMTGAGTMKDSDWLDGPVEVQEVGSSHPGKDIYSTSRAELTAVVFDGRVAWQLTAIPAASPTAPSLRIAPMVGYLYQDFSFDVYDVSQVGYGPWSAYTGTVPGKGLTYDVAWSALYLGARGELGWGPLTAALDAWYSPAATGKDEDDHLLRGKLSKTDASGSAWQVRLAGSWALGLRDAVSVQGSVLGFSATGTQTQTFYAGPDAGLTGTIPAKLTSLRWSAGLAWIHRL